MLFISVLTVVSSLASLVWTIRAWYGENYVHAEDIINDYRWLAEVCLLLWPLLTITPHVISLALFELRYTWIVFPVVVAHCLVMAAEKFVKEYQEDGKCLAIFWSTLLCFPRTFILCFFNKGFHLSEVLWTYTIQLTLDTVMCTSWFVSGGKDTMYGIPAALVVWYGFFFGIMFMGLLVYLEKTERNSSNA